MKYTPYKDYLGMPLYIDTDFNNVKDSFDKALYYLLLDYGISMNGIVPVK